MNMKKMSTLLMQVTISSVAILTLVSCKMPPNPLEVTISDSSSQPTIFDRTFRGAVVTNMINELSYVNPKQNKTAWLIDNEAEITALDPEIAPGFYEDFRTKTYDVSFSRLDILNKISQTKLKFTNATVEVRVLEGMSLAAVTNKEASINFSLYFKGRSTYIFTGTINWIYDIVKVDKKEEYSFGWKFDKEKANIKITTLKKS